MTAAAQILLLAVLIYSLLENIRGRRLSERISIRFERTADSRISRMLRAADALIARAGIKGKIPFLSAEVLVLGCFSIFAFGIFFLRKLGFAALLYSAVLAYIPYAAVSFFAFAGTRKVRAMYLTFLSTFSGFYGIESGNIMNALKSTAAYLAEPLRSIILRNVLLFETGVRSTEEALDGIALEVGYGEFRKFARLAKLNAKYGGDFGKVLEKMRERAERLNSIEAVKSANASVGTLVIFFMILFDLAFVFSVSREPEMAYILMRTTVGQVIVLANAAAVVFGLFIIMNLNYHA
jgi:tight adherence protein B